MDPQVSVAAADEKIKSPRSQGVGWARVHAICELRIDFRLAFAEQVQRFVHENISNSQRPEGWDNQLEDEPALVLSYHWRRLLPGVDWWNADGDKKFFDLTPHATGVVGNVFTQGGAGLTARLGYGLSPEFADAMRPVAAGPSPTTKWGFNVFVSAEGRAVLHSIFLDGNTLRDSHSVDKKTWVGDFRIGATLRFRSWSLTYQAITGD